jgi:dienelactone hydrolase
LGETHGAVIASIAYPFEGDLDAKGLAMVAQVPAIRRAFYDTPPAVSLALDHLLALPGVDPARVELVGASFGAPFATIAAARDARVSRLWIAHGGGRPLLLIARGLEREIPWAILRWPIAVIANVLASGPRFAPERFVARVAPRPVIMLNATEDERIPRASVDALWAAVREPREQVWLPGLHMQGSRPEVLRALVDSVMIRARVPSRRD